MIQLYFKEEESLYTALHNKIYVINDRIHNLKHIYMYVLMMSQTDGLAKNKGQIHL